MENYNEIKYMHVERVGTTEVDGLLDGKVYIYPKIDGTNGVVWYDKDNKCVLVGSRNRQLSLGKDNAGFYSYICTNENIKQYLADYPDTILYGEWLVPHTIKNYRDDCWRKFYVFDVGVIKEGEVQYLPYEDYCRILEKYNITFLRPLAVINHPTIDDICLATENSVLLKDGCVGEGVVCKNYDFYNKYGRQVWGKYIHKSFTDNHSEQKNNKENVVKSVEGKIVDKYINRGFVEKEFQKIVVSENGEWSSKMILRLLNTVFYTLVKEETWEFIKENKNPKIDFKLLQQLVFGKTKELLPEILDSLTEKE